ncbi:unnamed protein product [Nyctereutes procyonoides]|uniref:(raccoon dog) hypothetical protein n=1 Tax=Nyctereutes procyonoides TaxID=34880 RepID=A0A811YM18_NYCPR|nr:unnamed protein product [Nyctereutes procyonoides]
MPLVKKKKGHSTLCEECLEPKTVLRAGRTGKLSSSRKQALGSSEFQGGEKKKKRKEDEKVTRFGKKPKKHKKEKKTQEATASSAKDPWFCQSGDALYTCSQGSPRECSVKMKKKKKIHQKGDTFLGHLECSKSVERSPRKGSKKPVKIEAPEYISIGHNPKPPAKKKMKSEKKTEQPGIEEPSLKRNKKKGKESKVVEESWEEEPDTDLEVVLEKKGNMDEAHIDQVRKKALQEEIDHESGKTEVSEPKKWTGTQFGQWDTAGFENEEQKLKFLKIMGGFKNVSASFTHPSNTIGRPNMALNKKAANALQQNLQQDYDQAMSWKYKRGASLGFSSTPDKIFYIDRNASKSIKLED